MIAPKIKIFFILIVLNLNFFYFIILEFLARPCSAVPGTLHIARLDTRKK